jgi:hypothetical protein
MRLFADVQDHALTGRFSVRRSENRPSQVAQLPTFTVGSFQTSPLAVAKQSTTLGQPITEREALVESS